mmetsp:Transcript_61422/g.170299  ORF Transcript_61422/g.170299 Transcript_61422/m.170299 type:complete len:113 (-) Transcript_61422:40-378(-)
MHGPLAAELRTGLRVLRALGVVDTILLERGVAGTYFSVYQTTGHMLRGVEEAFVVGKFLLEWVSVLLYIVDNRSCAWGSPSAVATAWRRTPTRAFGPTTPLAARPPESARGR